MQAQAQARRQPVRIEFNTSALPRLDAQDGGFQAPRVDLSVSPHSHGLGLVVGFSGVGVRPAFQPNLLAAAPSMDLGLRWRQVVLSKQVDVTAWRRMSSDEDAFTLVQQQTPVYGARVEMKMDAPRRSLFTASPGFLGLQLEGGAKISIRRKNGGPMVYYRQNF